jgi:hypothetical protein
MKLPPEETERFYRIWWALLHYTNAHHRVLPEFPSDPRNGALPVPKAAKLRDALWGDDPLRERFVAENPAGLPPADLEIVTSWQDRVAGHFLVLRYLKRHAIFLEGGPPTRVYGVLGLVSGIDEVLGPVLPIYTEAVLLPFAGKIIYDSLLRPFPVTFGSGIRRGLGEDYREARTSEGIITSLPPLAGPPAQRRKR